MLSKLSLVVFGVALLFSVIEDFIKNNLPDNEDDLRAFLRALADLAAGGVSGGQGEAQIFVDGFSGGRLPPREAIHQIRINQNPFTAEFSNPGYGLCDALRALAPSGAASARVQMSLLTEPE